MHAYSWFATFTYSPEHVPSNGSLDYSHFQQFMRRLRKVKRHRVRFFCAGEYGGATARPHYHAALFGVEFADLAYYRKSPSGHTLWKSAQLDELWGRGLCSLGRLTFESAAYTAAYITKKVIISDESPAAQKEHYKRVDATTGEVFYVKPEFARMSLKPGIGSTWLDKYASDALPRDYVVMDGQKVPVPRYYSDRMRKRDLPLMAGVECERQLNGLAYEHEKTSARLAVREAVAIAKLSTKHRDKL